MRLAKLHGLGNDFLISQAGESADPGAPLGAIVRKVCDRRTGIGADGVVFYQPTVSDREADASAVIFNADGSRAEMSGNGTRCLAAHLVRTREIDSRVVRIRTVCGIKSFTLKNRSASIYTFESALGHPVTDPARIPVRLGSGTKLVDFPLETGSGSVRVTVTSMGNPHCSTFWPDVERAPVESLGSVLESHVCFPERCNVEFVQVLDRHRIRVRFWERGVGPTPASGTGSSAAVVAAILNGLVDSPVEVEVELGRLQVDWRPPGELLLTGPAEHICDVDYPV
jgi:diaminopimelate epimerase